MTDDGHTIDVGYVHTLTDDGECRPDCPHPDHRRGAAVIEELRNVCPECVAGKHQNCDGKAWDFNHDRPIACDCCTYNHPVLYPTERH